MTDFEIPRCGHGNIILGCPHEDCIEQNEYLAEFNGALDDYLEQQRQGARRFVREQLGLEV